MKNLMKINNGGGISIERYDTQGDIVSVFAGLEFHDEKNLLNDFVTYGTEWNFDDAGGNTTGYHENGNTSGDLKIYTDEELEAIDIIDDHESTIVIAEWDGEELKISKRGFIYFGIA